MCLLTFFPEAVMPDTAALFNGALFNDDGHGYAIVAEDRLIVGRGMNATHMIEEFQAARRQHPHGPALFHSRFGTHGQRGTANCHPFPLGGDTRTVLAHNGVLPAAVQPGKNDPRSDTRIAAEEFLPTFASLRTRRGRLRLQRWMTPDNKIVILTVDRRFRQRAYILNEQSGIWDGRIWYSNDGYLPLQTSRWTRRTDELWERRLDRLAGWDRLDRCVYCQAVVDPSEGYCCYCGWCCDCDQPLEDCFCYPPPVLDKPITRGANT